MARVFFAVVRVMFACVVVPATLPFTGFYNVPSLNLSTCSVPKGGSSMMRTVVARMAGVLHDRCHFPWGVEEDRALEARGVTTEYDPSLTTVLQIRDPWTRAVSQFSDQIKRGHVRADPESPRDFLAYLRATPAHEHRHHTGSASAYCAGRRDARFDHVIDLEDVASFYRVATRVPALGRATDRGWSHCTRGAESLYMVGTIATHRSKPGLATTLCTEEAMRLVCHLYADDYRLYARLHHPYRCECLRRTSGANTTS